MSVGFSLNVHGTMIMDIVILILLYGCTFCLWYFTSPHKRGFWTGDMSIQYPFTPCKVSVWYILLFFYTTPTLVILFTEWALLRKHPGEQLTRFSFVTLANLFVNCFFKFTIGRLRPHFLSVCQISGKEDGVTLHNGDKFVQDYTCKDDARQSFYSGHASISLCAATYLIVYMQEHYPRCLTKSFFQVIILLSGFYPGISQVNNYHHHWSDVATGYAAGVTFALLGYFFV